MKEMEPIAIDAFCGAGGLSLGLNKAGFKIIGGFDLDPICIKTLKNNKKYIKHQVFEADIKEMLSGNLLKILGIKSHKVHLLAGGPPCQGFSVQRTIGGDHDSRNLLVDDYADLISEIMPQFFLLENVTGIGGRRGKEIMERFKLKISLNGYYLHEKILDAQNYGVPQRRKRYILVGELLNNSVPFFSWPCPDQNRYLTVRDVISHLPSPPIGKDHVDFSGHRADKLSSKNLSRIRILKSGESRVNLPRELLADCHKKSANLIGHRNVYGRMAWDEVAPTITARFDSFTRGKFGHPEQDRSISLYEGSLLQTFPEDYIFTGNKVEIARQIGNAVPPKFAEALGLSIMKALKEREERDGLRKTNTTISKVVSNCL